MKVVICVVIAVVVLVGAAVAQTPTAARPEKHTEITGEPTYGGRIEGDTIEECWVIPSLPFIGTDSTCGFADDYEEMCPYGSNSVDVVYSYSPPSDMCVSISLCDSYYDTKLFVYEDELTPGVPYACNDDNFACSDPPVDYTSLLAEVELFAGHTYYIVVDGYGGQCGDYVLAVEEFDCHVLCDVICVGVPEGEPTCYNGYDDQYNGGCASLTWSYITPTPEPSVLCGESGVFMYDSSIYRDTDWYLIYPCGGVPITATVESEIPVLLMYIDLRGGCANMEVYSYVYAEACVLTSLTEYLPLGKFAVWVGPDDWLVEYVCGSEYSLTIEGYTEHCDPTPVEGLSWGRVKALYR